MSAATPEATRACAERYQARGHAPAAARILGRTGLTVSALGFGAYRVGEGNPEHRRSLEAAIRAGCNLVDTSTNYTDGESEQVIGAVLEAMTGGGEISRSEMVVVSKIGYVQGQNLELARRRERSGEPFPEMVKISDGCWHCIHPRFLEDQLARSLGRLRLDRLDACLLHNPEYFLEDAHRRGEDPTRAREAFYGRMRAAFVHLEGEVRRGRIGWYGVSSNSFGAPAGDPESTSLGRMLEEARGAAREAGGIPEDHHFAVAQLPLNLFETGPLTAVKEGPGGGYSTLGWASENQVAILVNRPLNAISGGALIRLADFRPSPSGSSRAEAQRAVGILEEEFRREFESRIPSARTEGFSWARHLAGFPESSIGYEQWEAIRDHQIQPHLFHSVSILRSSLPPETRPAVESWLGRYLPALGALLAELGGAAAAESQRRSDRIAAGLDPSLPPSLRLESLSRKALHAVASLPGVTCVLNGMRTPRYVEDSTGILAWPRLESPERLFTTQ